MVDIGFRDLAELSIKKLPEIGCRVEPVSPEEADEHNEFAHFMPDIGKYFLTGKTSGKIGIHRDLLDNRPFSINKMLIEEDTIDAQLLRSLWHEMAHFFHYRIDPAGFLKKDQFESEIIAETTSINLFATMTPAITKDQQDALRRHLQSYLFEQELQTTKKPDRPYCEIMIRIVKTTIHDFIGDFCVNQFTE